MATVSMTYMPLLLPLTGLIIGLIVGSFANVVIYRVPRGESIVTGRSRCTNCGKKIAWYDLIPIVSFFLLGFHCRQCHHPISWQYAAVELYSGIIFLLAFHVGQQSGIPYRLFSVFILESLLILALIDLKNLILPDSVLLVMLAGVVGYGISEILYGSQIFKIFSLNNLISAVILFATLFFLWFLSRGVWIGLGDAKLAGLMGLIFGAWGGLIIFYGAIIIGVVAGIVLLACPPKFFNMLCKIMPLASVEKFGRVNRRADLKTKLPLGTLISFSATVYIFFGAVILDKIKPFFYSVPFILK